MSTMARGWICDTCDTINHLNNGDKCLCCDTLYEPRDMPKMYYYKGITTTIAHHAKKWGLTYESMYYRIRKTNNFKALMGICKKNNKKL
jgi:hypothetical protein